MADILETIKSRRSVRKFKNKKLEEEKINKILTAGAWAPSGLNNQPWRFILVESQEYKNKLASLTKYGSIIKNAPVALLVYLDKASSYDREKDIMAIGACIQNMLLEAHSLGLGSCWLGEILKNKHKVNEIFDVDNRYELFAVIGFGYPSQSPVSARKQIKDLILKRV
jgi:nitroreductase